MLIHGAAVSLNGHNNRNEQVHYYLGPFNQINNNVHPHFVPRIGVIQQEWGSASHRECTEVVDLTLTWTDEERLYLLQCAAVARLCPTRLYQLLFGTKM